jgi:hypothetical protein
LKYLLHAFTGVDNQTTDLGRVLLAFAMLALIGQDIWNTIHGTFNPATSAAAYATLLVGGCGAIRIKAETEPKPAEPK